MHKGNKAAYLERLKKGGFAVPPFFVCDGPLLKSDILVKINKELPTAKYFAVRSSAEGEDSKERSYAGHFYSAIGISKEGVYDEITKVRDSFGGVSGSVIVQKFVPSDGAGVMFTDVADNKVIIDAIKGLCRPVVNGLACDEYICDKNGKLLDKTISAEKECEFFKDGNIFSQKDKGESLTEENLKQLVSIAIKIQALFGSPQDIEWCFEGGKLYVLQSRPVTRGLNLVEKEYFDSANIAESYSGIVLPLTCSFAKMIYEQVYKDLLRMSGVSAKKIAGNSKIFKNLLGFFYGRIYYNMNNWYQLSAFVPGYKRNKENFELMITSNTKQNIVTSISPSLALKIAYPFILVSKTLIFGLTSLHFKKVVQGEIRRFRVHDFASLRYEECITLFEDLHRRLLQRWYITVENDFFVMTYLGVLKKLVGEQLLQKMITFESKATEQVGALVTLSKGMKSNQLLWNAIETCDMQAFDKELAKDIKAASLLKDYLMQFGGRFANELKLESVGIEEDAKKLFSVLKIYVSYETSEHVPHQNIQLPFSKRFAVYFILGKFKKYASRREEFRLLRSNAFAIIRRLFRRIGELLATRGAIQNADDVFYLMMEEILDCSALENKKFLELVEKRKREYVVYGSITPPAHFVRVNNQPPPFHVPEMSGSGDMQARPASPGIVRGRVRVFKDFLMPEKIDFDILVTSHTDPGWTPLIALSKGLIIEHGGVLSHASIVARELQIPAVIGAVNAVNSLRNGQIVEINGSTGMIKII